MSLARAVRWVVALVPACLACASSTRTQVETAATGVILPPQDEVMLGRQIEAELSKQQKYVSDPQITTYVDELAGRVFQAAKSESANLSVKVHVIDDPKTANAFATPGSQLYVFSGLLLAANSDAELATVLGHETGHIVARHPARHMVSALGVSAIADMVLGKNPSLLTQLGAAVASQGYLLANSRADETEADELGARFASRAGYDPRALGHFLSRIAAKGEPPGFMVIFSDHPLTPDRITHLEGYITQHRLTGREGDGARLAAVKQALGSSGIGGGPKQEQP